MRKEKIKLMEIFKQDEQLTCVISPDVENLFELYGFILLNIDDMKAKLKAQMKTLDSDGTELID